jgi:hypothetical protein
MLKVFPGATRISENSSMFVGFPDCSQVRTISTGARLYAYKVIVFGLYCKTASGGGAMNGESI